jgi:YfiH family protein
MSDLDLIQSTEFADARITHAFTTRAGGVSSGPFGNLNMSWSRGDDKAYVETNRARVAKALGGIELVFANQIHSDQILKVERKPSDVWSAGEGDALITDKAGLGLCAQAADCVPILLFDPRRPAIAAIHSGWRGTVQAIAPKTVTRLNEAYGSQASNIRAVIGPAISKENYRVGPEVLEQFQTLFGALDNELIGPVDSEGGAGLDVAEACCRQLVEAGVPPHQISRITACTFDQADRFFSCRRAARDGHAGQFGGQCGIIALKP